MPIIKNVIIDNPIDQQWIWNLMLSLVQFGPQGLPLDDLHMTMLMMAREVSKHDTKGFTRGGFATYFNRLNEYGRRQWLTDAAVAMFDVMVGSKMFVKSTELYPRLNGGNDPYYVMTLEANEILDGYYASLGLNRNGDLK
jgi:hypothetical protein